MLKEFIKEEIMRAILLLLVLAGCFLNHHTASGQFKVIGYLPTWNGYPASLSNVDLTKVTHLNIAFANPNSNGDISTYSGTNANLATVVSAAHAQNVKVLMSLGGAGAPGATYTSLITNDLAGFVAKIVQYAVDNNLDGIDVDIEGDVLNGTTMNSVQYENFIVALEPALHAQNKLMTAALATWFAARVSNNAASKFDFINIMSYDAYGTWTGPGQHSPYSLAVTDLDYWINTKGVPGSKLTVGVPFYGYSWSTSNTSRTFSSIVSAYPGSENKDQVNPSSGGVIYYNGIPTIKQKTVLALSQTGGIMIWELTNDASGSKSLLSAIDEVIQGYPSNATPTGSISAPATGTVYTEGDTIEIELDAADSDGSIMKIEYFAGTVKIGEQYGDPTTLQWSGAGTGTYSITAIVTDNIGASITTAAISVTVNAAAESLPFAGIPYTIPGKIEAENFNLGGNNVGYKDLTTANQGGEYRTGQVDIETCADNGGGYDVGWTQTGEWLEYSVYVTYTGLYAFQLRVATENTGKTFYIQMNGTNVTGTVNVPNTGGWQKWQTVTAPTVLLTEGVQKMRLVFTSGDFNVNYINVAASYPTATIDASVYEASAKVYPNPLEQSSKLNFYLKQAGQTTIELFDAKGTKIKVLASGFMNAGENELPVTKEALPKGIYLCRISGEQDTFALKIVVE